MHRFRCTGWWEQPGLGRQPMDQLVLEYADGALSGSGTDIVGEFVLSGRMTGPTVFLLKQYIDRHKIEYHGTWDGEGIYSGKWSYYGAVGGDWLIAVKSLHSQGFGSQC